MAAVDEEQMEDDMANAGPMPLARLEVYTVIETSSDISRETESRQEI
jgi:hypothetical protein